MSQQQVELIPVVEIFVYHEDVEMPESGPYWEYPQEWELYNRQCNLKAGFSSRLKSYRQGSSFYNINSISDEDLFLLLKIELEKQRSDDETEILSVDSAFQGGYILTVDGEDVYFPQCCANLADIEEWEDLVEDNGGRFYSGHPSPSISKVSNTFLFDFINTEIQDPFSPRITVNEIYIDEMSLKVAYEKVKGELTIFSERLEEINRQQNLRIKNLSDILVYGKTD